jgi:hypothetical protein
LAAIGASAWAAAENGWIATIFQLWWCTIKEWTSRFPI